MKKIALLLTATVVSASIFMGCGDASTNDSASTSVSTESQKSNSKFKEENGTMVYTDTENCPFEDCGLKIVIDSSKKDGKFTKTTKEGEESSDYYDFNYETNTVEKYYYVSAMGTAYYYTYDLEKGELVKVEGQNHEDKTESTKSSGRWDKSAEKVKTEVEQIEKYFEEQYGVSLKEACTDSNFGK